MATIYNSIMSLIKPGRIATAAATLEENEHKVSAGVDIILPTLLACMLKKGDTPEIEEVIKEGKKIKAWENYDRIWHGSGVDEHVNLGERMENRILSPHSQKFNTTLGHKVGLIRTGHADRLTNWVAGTVAAAFAQHMTTGGASYKELLAQLAGEKEALRKDIPADIIEELGLGHVLGVTAPHKAAAPHAAAPRVAAPKVTAPAPTKSSMGWLWWLLGIIALALIIFFCVRSCNAKKVVAPIAAGITEVTEVKEVHVAPKFEGIPMVLPDGTKITMYKGHLEEAVKSYLDSDKFKNATDAELRSVWFEFTDIDFEHNKATELMAGSQDRLMSLVKTLDKYPNTKIKIGAFGDKTGTRAINFAITEARAETIRQTLVASGFPAANLSIEGFGKEFAAAPADSPDSQRAPDRDIAMRFTK
jgi:outer membrane protein OmpA-like peptidoglycan-associated protein